ncbi:hypothetical protein NDU88_007100 [Pleurodeles waltl]|uniref:Uncharacterized protein n=1 Tax=Pleurodeles waltl TaxID=8319 RepID=A0AAV7RTS8_PLEWA|nr:hypothetical protein NDU88_007100 [Pleurodeles waltl]
MEVRPERDWRPSPRGVLRVARQRWDALHREAIGPPAESLLERGEKSRGRSPLPYTWGLQQPWTRVGSTARRAGQVPPAREYCERGAPAGRLELRPPPAPPDRCERRTGLAVAQGEVRLAALKGHT